MEKDVDILEKQSKRALQAEQTKRLLYQQATRLMKEKGFYNVSIEDIAKASGVSTGTFYYYFESKEDLMLIWADELDQHYVDYYNREMQRIPQRSVLEILQGIINLSLEIYCALGRDFAVVSYSYIMRSAKANERYSDSFRILSPDPPQTNQ